PRLPRSPLFPYTTLFRSRTPRFSSPRGPSLFCAAGRIADGSNCTGRGASLVEAAAAAARFAGASGATSLKNEKTLLTDSFTFGGGAAGFGAGRGGCIGGRCCCVDGLRFPYCCDP